METREAYATAEALRPDLQTVSCPLRQTDVRGLDHLASQQQTSRSAVIRQAVRAWLTEHYPERLAKA